MEWMTGVMKLTMDDAFMDAPTENYLGKAGHRSKHS